MTAAGPTAAALPLAAPPVQRAPLAVAVLALAALAAGAAEAGGGRAAAAALIGAAAGVALYHASFGFTSAWRRMQRDRRGAGLRAQFLLIGLASVVSYPLMAWGGAIGLPMQGWILPIGMVSAFGAFLFGVGMQLGGGCGSGTLYTVGGGSVRMVTVLAFFIAGSTLATLHWDFWTGWPRTRAGVSALAVLGGPIPALAALLAGLGALWAVSVAVERRAHGALEVAAPTGSVWRGPWSPATGAVALALVCWACFVALGRPWGVTEAFALWGGKIAQAGGASVTEWSSYWSGWRAASLEAPVLADLTSVMDLGLVAGAMAAAALAGRWAPGLRLSRRDFLTAVAGGLLMGYGARLAYGCNIGAYLGGLVSGSLHGVWWLAWAALGSGLGVWARGRLGVDPPPAPRGTATPAPI